MLSQHLVHFLHVAVPISEDVRIAKITQRICRPSVKCREELVQCIRDVSD